jgi:hypothetical protein
MPVLVGGRPRSYRLILRFFGADAGWFQIDSSIAGSSEDAQRPCLLRGRWGETRV